MGLDLELNWGGEALICILIHKRNIKRMRVRILVPEFAHVYFVYTKDIIILRHHQDVGGRGLPINLSS